MSAFIDYSKFVPRDTHISWEKMPYEDPYVKLIKSLRTTPGSTNVTVAQKTPENHVAIHKTEVVASAAQKVAFVDSMGSLLSSGDNEEPTETDKNADTAAAVAGKKGPGRPKGAKESSEAKELKAQARALALILKKGEAPPIGSPGHAVGKRQKANEDAAKAKAAAAAAKTPAEKRAARKALIEAHLPSRTPGDDSGFETTHSGYESEGPPKKAASGKKKKRGLNLETTKPPTRASSGGASKAKRNTLDFSDEM